MALLTPLLPLLVVMFSSDRFVGERFAVTPTGAKGVAFTAPHVPPLFILAIVAVPRAFLTATHTASMHFKTAPSRHVKLVALLCYD